MGIINRFPGGAGGGSGLTVSAVADYASLPANPKLYQLCIVSATAVSGVYVTNTAPANPVAGVVQIVVGSASAQPVPADSKGTVTIYPVNAYQYAGGLWTLRDLYTWNGTSWVTPARYLVLAGVDNASFGGAYTLTAGTITLYSGYLQQFGSSLGELRKPTAIDVTPYRTLYIHAKNLFSQGTVKGYTRLSLAGANAQEVIIGGTESVYTIDLAAATGLRYLGISIPASTGLYLWNWWLE